MSGYEWITIKEHDRSGGIKSVIDIREQAIAARQIVYGSGLIRVWVVGIQLPFSVADTADNRKALGITA